jgi:hypothetical protein
VSKISAKLLTVFELEVIIVRRRRRRRRRRRKILSKNKNNIVFPAGKLGGEA